MVNPHHSRIGIQLRHTSTFCGWMRSRSLGNTCAGIPTTGSNGCAVIAGRKRRIAGDCACWKTRP